MRLIKKNIMKDTFFSTEEFCRLPLIGIVRNLPFETIQQILPLYRSAGLSAIEITMNTPDAKAIIQHASETYGRDLQIGAGTVCNTDELEEALQAGAGFIVTPLLDEQVIRRCVQRGVPVFAGAFTPTEIYKAWSWGADMVKIFPATRLGPGYIKDIKGPLNQIRLLPTGGINLDNCTDFLQAGASGLGLGGQLFDHNLISSENWEGLQKHFTLFVKKLNAYYDATTRKD
jgi:2-dehydro-3-deoxyphosphogluconate aldolase/(4S)-4-hydroxy-2-oxoglutarate aldolase